LNNHLLVPLDLGLSLLHLTLGIFLAFLLGLFFLLSLHPYSDNLFYLPLLQLLLDLCLLLLILQPSNAILKHLQLDFSLSLLPEAFKHDGSFSVVLGMVQRNQLLRTMEVRRE
jgi:hypothetical protein